jgi:hypothetical protein
LGGGFGEVERVGGFPDAAFAGDDVDAHVVSAGGVEVVVAVD